MLDRARKRVYVYSLAGAYVVGQSFNLHSDIAAPTGIVGIADRIWIHSRGTFYSLNPDGTREDTEDFDAHADNTNGKNLGTDGSRLLCLDNTARRVFGYTTTGAYALFYSWNLDADNDDPTGLGFRDGVYYVLNSHISTPDLIGYETVDTIPIGDESPFPWEEVASLTFSVRDGDGFNRVKMFTSPQWDNENLVVGFRREGDTEDDFSQAIFQQTGPVVEVGTKEAYEIPVARAAIADALDEGVVADIDPDISNDYSLRLLMPALPLIEDFPSGRGPVWLWAAVSADVASAIENITDTDPWPDAAVAVADEVTPGDNAVGDIVTLYRGGIISTRGWDATSETWVTVDGFVDGNLFVQGTIQTGALAANSVTAPKMFIGDGLIAGTDGSLMLSLGPDSGLTLTADGVLINAGASSGLAVGPTGVAIQVANNGLLVNTSGIALQVGPDSGLLIGPAGVGIQAAGNSLVVNSSGIALAGGIRQRAHSRPQRGIDRDGKRWPRPGARRYRPRRGEWKRALDWPRWRQHPVSRQQPRGQLLWDRSCR